ncbi:hypothetical protein EVA_17696, partial [gut metagenome]
MTEETKTRLQPKKLRSRLKLKTQQKLPLRSLQS